MKLGLDKALVRVQTLTELLKRMCVFGIPLDRTLCVLPCCTLSCHQLLQGAECFPVFMKSGLDKRLHIAHRQKYCT
jgi:hypothetical protein